MYAGILGQINDFIEVKVIPLIMKYLGFEPKAQNFVRDISPQLKFNWQKSYQVGYTNVPPKPKGYAPIFDLNSFESFYERRLYCKVAPGFHRPISSPPGKFIDIMQRKKLGDSESIVLTGETKRCLNLGSYNYLGFAENPKHVTEDVLAAVDKFGIGPTSSTNDWGYSTLHRQMEQRIAKFIGKEDAICFGMGFVTNSSIIPAIAEGEKTLIISDSLNHMSIVTGARHSGCRIKVFTHSDMEELEQVLRVSIAEGWQPKVFPKKTLQEEKAIKRGGIKRQLRETENKLTSKIMKVMNFAENQTAKIQGFVEKIMHLEKEEKQIKREYVPWDKIIVLVEGVYSMEGEICDLKNIVGLKKKYGFYLYVDEAHSIGGVGKTGRGVTEHHGVDPKDVDVLMGTFTKSFGSVGGYIAASQDYINFLRSKIGVLNYGAAMANGCMQQIISAHKVITGEDGTKLGEQKLKQIYENSNYFRDGLKKMGFEVIGDVGSPVIVAMLYLPTQLFVFSKLCMERGLAIVTVGPPASDLFETRARFCISSAHDRESLKAALEVISEVGELTQSKYYTNQKLSVWERIKTLTVF